MNKKIVILIEILVIVMAIVVVSVYGPAADNWRDNVYATAVEFYEQDATYIDTANNGIDGALLQINLEQGIDTSYQLKWRVLPDEATVKSVQFSFSGGVRQANGDVSNDRITVTSSGLVVFTTGTVVAVDITVTVTDKSGCTDVIRIYPFIEQGGELPLG